MKMVVIGLGTNLGDRYQNLLAALDSLSQFLIFQAVSSIYETKPVGYLEQPLFLNAVSYFYTNLLPLEILKRCKKIEKKLGRVAGPKFGPRVIDLDILFYENRVFESKHLILPHPRLCERAFVLLPLSEILPYFKHPQTGKSVKDMLLDLSYSNDDIYLYSRQWVK